MIVRSFHHDATRRLAESRAVWLSAICLSLALVLIAAPRSDAHFVQSSYASAGSGCTPAERAGPVTMIFYGIEATAAKADTVVRELAGWTWRTGENQWLPSHVACNHFNFQDASAHTTSRYHVRLWQMPGLDVNYRYVTYATPHHEDYGCGIPGSYSIDPDSPEGSGFDKGRTELGTIIGGTYPLEDVQNWQNTQSFWQCDGSLASSNGVVLWYKLDPQPLARATSTGEPAAPTTPRLKGCSEPTRLFNVGDKFDRLTLTAVHRVCSNPRPMVSESAGGIDPDSLGRSNFTSFLYGDCAPRGDAGCASPLEIQVWPTCERDPTRYDDVKPVGDLGPDEVGGPRLVARMTIRQMPVFVFEGRAAAEPDRVEAVVGGSTVVVFLGAGGGSTLDDMLRVIEELRPAGTSVGRTSGVANSLGGPLAAPADGALAGGRGC